jgi:hypothetical protein
MRDSGHRGKEAHVTSSSYWIGAVIGVVILVVGVLIRGSHHTIGLVAIILGVLLAIAGIDREHQRIAGRVEIQATHVGGSLLEVRSGRNRSSPRHY